MSERVIWREESENGWPKVSPQGDKTSSLPALLCVKRRVESKNLFTFEPKENQFQSSICKLYKVSITTGYHMRKELERNFDQQHKGNHGKGTN